LLVVAWLCLRSNFYQEVIDVQQEKATAHQEFDRAWKPD
jgi:hypothetical protein